MTVGSVEKSFDELVSPAAITWAVVFTVTVATAVGMTLMVIVTLPPAANATEDGQVRIWVPAPVQVPIAKPVPVTPVKDRFVVGDVSLICQPMAAVTAPALWTTSVYVLATPLTKLPVCVRPFPALVMSRSADGAATIAKETGSVALLFAVFAGGSPPPETVAVL